MGLPLRGSVVDGRIADLDLERTPAERLGAEKCLHRAPLTDHALNVGAIARVSLLAMCPWTPSAAVG